MKPRPSKIKTPATRAGSLVDRVIDLTEKQRKKLGDDEIVAWMMKGKGPARGFIVEAAVPPVRLYPYLNRTEVGGIKRIGGIQRIVVAPKARRDRQYAKLGEHLAKIGLDGVELSAANAYCVDMSPADLPKLLSSPLVRLVRFNRKIGA
ncbi:MAG: hypothetical protein ACKVZJ_12550 [Phycisphaerales bacterium]